MKLTGCVVLALTVLALSPRAGRAFGTVNFLGQSAEHEKITRLALAPFAIDPNTLSELTGRPKTFGAVGAPDAPTRGLLLNTPAHCDGGDVLDVPGYPRDRPSAAAALNGCRQWIFQNLRTAVDIAGGLVDATGRIVRARPARATCAFDGEAEGVKCNVLAAIGLAFHAGQDFYSHTNWTDVAAEGPGSLANPPGLGHEGRAPWLDPRRDIEMPAGLISGCFAGVPEALFCKDRVRHAVLSKDTGKIDIKTGSIGAGTTERARGNDNFARAVRAAIEDTRDKWNFFEEQVVVTHGDNRGRLINCVMRRDDGSGCDYSQSKTK